LAGDYRVLLARLFDGAGGATASERRAILDSLATVAPLVFLTLTV